MRPLERAGFLAHARSTRFRHRVESSEGCIREALTLGAASVACSWGKDSIAMLHLCQSIHPDIRVVFFTDPEQERIDNYAVVIAAYLARFPHTRYEEWAIAGDRVPDKVHVARLWERDPVSFVGIRAEECAARRISGARQGRIHRYVSGAKVGSVRVWPLFDWSWREVWAYLMLHDLPSLASYDADSNDARDRSRTCNLVAKRLPDGPKGSNLGRIARLRMRNPAYFNYLAAFHPDVARWGQ